MDNPFSREAGGWGNAQPNQGPSRTFFAQAKIPLTLGEVIDGYTHLSDGDKAIFAAACLGRGTGTTPADAGALPPGKTRDPKTGKVFKITPKREKTQVRKDLESTLASAKKAYSAYLQKNNIILGDDGLPKEDVPRELIPEGSALYKAIDAAKTALAAYKAAHPEEFLPPPNKKAGLSSLEVMASTKPSPKGKEPAGGPADPKGSTSPKGGKPAPKGVKTGGSGSS